jgi:membrane associated rhomboid family serine protease
MVESVHPLDPRVRKDPWWSYPLSMVTVIRVARLALLLVLAVVAVSLLIALFRPETGGYEKAALAALVAACFGMGVAVTAAARHLRRRMAVSRESGAQR